VAFGVIDQIVKQAPGVSGQIVGRERDGLSELGGQARREGVRLDVEIVGDGSGKDAFRGRIGGARQTAQPVVFVDQPGAQRPCPPVDPLDD